MKEVQTFIKKNVILNKFVELVGNKRTKHEYKEVAQKTLEELGIDGGAIVPDFVENDFNGTWVSKERAETICNRSKQERKIPAKMMIDYILSVGVKQLMKIDEQNGVYSREERLVRSSQNEPVSLSSRLTNNCYDRLCWEARKQNVPMGVILEKAVFAYAGGEKK